MNWVAYKGGSKTKTARTKKTIHGEIVQLLAKHGLLRDRPAVKAKLTELVCQFNKAQDWVNATGAGIRGAAREEY